MLRKETHVFAKKVFYKFIFNLTCLQQNFHENIYYTLQINIFIILCRTTLKYLIAAPLAVLFYCEWLVYVIQPLFWQGLECKHPSKCTKILLVADPQIQGEQAVPPPLSLLFNWDSDRYL